MSLAGSRCLSVFSHSLNARVLRAHDAGPLRPRDLEAALGWASQSSLRAAVKSLSAMGVLARVDGRLPATELTEAGLELLPIADALEHWLRDAQGGPIPLDDAAASGVLRALVAAWESAIVGAVAAEPHTLSELSTMTSDLNYPALKRRFSKLRSNNLITPVETGNTSAYVASRWLRQAALPLVLSARWESQHDPSAQPLSRTGMEALFLLALPLIDLPPRATGACALAVLTDGQGAKSKRVANIAIEVMQGVIVSASQRADAQPTWALGTTGAWLEAMLDGRSKALRIGGERPRLVQAIVKALHTGPFRT